MDFSLFYFANDSDVSDDAGRYELLLEGARFADRNGFTAVWTPERHFHRFGGLYPNPAVTGAALAVATERIQIRAGSVVAPLHHPLRIAEDWSVVDNLSGGRVGISFASGWHPADFVMRPDAHETRRQVMDETIETVRRLWRGESLTLPDGKNTPAEVRIFPPTVQRELPFWITSAGSVDTFRKAGAQGGGILTHLLSQDIDELRTKIAAYRESFRAHHGADRQGHVVLMLHTFLGSSAEEVRDVVRGPLSAYLKTSFGLISGSIGGRPGTFDSADIQEADVEYLVERGFNRFFERQGMFGTVEQGEQVVDILRRAGVDEIGCLVDFGVNTRQTLKSLEFLAELQIRCN
ncbi:MAG TPA: MupA/Atu3671 family FMN-dependent luciferase-like monooxygenase [Streptomyces sp.]|nr:MupA/Atu3671 family FMN-dependent luciferase-like monooxygenase [Streptomyces sp.]